MNNTARQSRNPVLTKAISLHHAGNLGGAETAYRIFLSSYPADFEALTLYGTLCLQRGDLLEGIKLIDRSLASNPKQPHAYNNRANALKELHRFDEALVDYDRAIALDNRFPEAWSNRGVVLSDLYRHQEALESGNKAIALRSTDARAFNNRGNALKALQRYEEALADYDRAVALNNRFAEAWSNRGAVLNNLQRHDEAIESCNKAISLCPSDTYAYNNRGNVLAAMKCYEKALLDYDKALTVNPDDTTGYRNRGDVLAEMKRYDEALASYEQATVLNPVYVDPYLRQSDVLFLLGRYHDALASCERATVVDPARANFVKAHIKIRLGEWNEAWELYECRLKLPQIQPFVRRFEQPLWLGAENLAGKTILVHAEQGLGDVIQFCRYVPLVEALGAMAVVEVPAALLRLVSTVSPSAQVVARGSSLPQFDFHCPLMSLPYAFRTTVETVPATIPYLAADTQKQMEWRERLGARTKPRVGLVWSGSGKMSTGPTFKRDIPFSDFQRLITPGVDYFCLQKDIRPADRDLLTSRGEIKTYTLEDFSDTAALTSEMDLVISIDTSGAHLAGALGKAVWTLLPADSNSSFLAKMVGREDSVWYPTARFFTQPQPGDWESIIIDVVEAQQTAFSDSKLRRR